MLKKSEQKWNLDRKSALIIIIEIALLQRKTQIRTIATSGRNVRMGPSKNVLLTSRPKEMCHRPPLPRFVLSF